MCAAGDGTGPPAARRVRPGQLRQIIRRFWPFAAPRKLWFLPVLLLAALGPAIQTAQIYLFAVLVDDVLIPRHFAAFPRIAALFVALTVVESLLSGAETVLGTWLGERFLIDLRVHVLRHLQTLSQEFFARSRMGDLLARMSGDISAIEGFLVSGTTDLVNDVLRLVFFLTALFWLQWQLALVALFVSPLFWLAARFFSTRLQTVSRERQRLSGTISSAVEQILTNLPLVQAYGQGERELARFRGQAEDKYRTEMRAARLRSLYAPTVDLIEMAGVLTVLGFGAWLLSRNQLSVGALLAFLTYLTSLYSPIRGLGGLVNSAYTASAGAERVIEVLDEKSTVSDAPHALDLSVAPVPVRFQAVSYSYPDADRPALHDLTFTVEPGQLLALVGESGAGKSTVGRLLLRFCDPTGGRVLLGDHDTRDLTLANLRRHVTVLLQDTLVLEGTVRDNIAYGRPDAPDEQVIAAAVDADADAFISRLPEGYQTRLGERGTRLSGGQRQRIAIARAMLRDSPVLLLDEPTTGLDPHAADRILGPLHRLMAGRATIVISHSLLTAREATQILVLEHGHVTEHGRHDQLLRDDGPYAKLWHAAGLTATPNTRPAAPRSPTRVRVDR
ncbi:MAG: transporter [Frankiales bacterium]|nr:transporter [Frankiales bacterium]